VIQWESACQIKIQKYLIEFLRQIILDGCEVLFDPFTALFKLLYNEEAIPDQQLVSKIIPVLKK
jgi:hypothetical protein